jgi:glutamate N-acetyltransferase/amino-acid N-acetyltransferase
VEPGEVGLARLGHAFESALLALAVSIVADGEGSTRTMRLTVTGATDQGRADAVARAVANSPLVKTAFFGRDANWGRIMQAIGQALGRDGHQALPARIAYENVVIVEKGQPAALDEVRQARLAEIMHQPEIDLMVALNGPGAEATVYFSDLTHDYVTLNAEYST